MADPKQIEQQLLLNKLLEQANSLGDDYTGILNSQHSVMNSMFEINSSGVDNHSSSINGLQGALDSLSKSQNTSKKSIDDQDRALKAITGSSNTAASGITALAAKLGSLSTVGVTISTIGKTFKLLSVGVSSATSILAGFAGSLFRLGLSLLTLPLGIINDLFSEAQQGGGSNDFRQALEDTRKIFGDLSKNESRAVVQSFRAIRGELAETGLSSRRILGNMAERLRFVLETAQHMGVAFSIVRGQVMRNSEAIAAYIKGLGLSEEGQRALANRAAATGTSITEIGRQMTTYAYQVGEAFGLNGKQISRDVGNMIGDIDNFGNMSVQSLTNVAVYARRLGVEVKALTKVIGTFDNFDKAAEAVGQLSQAFGLQLDTFSLVQEQDPAARIEQLRKSFFAAGRSIESMNRQERALLATHTGLDQETLALVFSQKSQSVSYADIQRKSDLARKSQLTQEQAMQKLSNSIERLVKSGQSLQGGLFDILFAGFASGIRMSGPFRHLMREIRQVMREVFRVGREMGRMFIDLFPGIRQVFSGLSQFLSPSGIGKNFQKLKQSFKEFLTGLTPQNAGKKISEFIKNLRTNFFGALSGPGLSQLRQGLATMGAVVMSLVAGMVRFVGTGVANAFRDAAAFIRNPQAFLQALQTGAGAAGNGLLTAFAPLIAAITDVAPDMWNAFKDLLSVVFDRIKVWVVGFAREHWMVIVGVLFGPAIISAALSAIAGTVASALVGGAGGILTRAMAGIGGLFRSGAAASSLSGVARGVSSAGGVADAATSSSALTNPASIVKMLITAAVIGVGIFAIVRGIMALAEEVKAKKLSASDVGIATLAMGAAVAIMLAISAATGPITAAGKVIIAGGLGIVAGIAAVAVIGTGLAFGMAGLISIFQGVSIGQLVVVGAAMTAAAIIAGEMMLVAIGLMAGGALISGPQAGFIVAGFLAVGVIGAALAYGMTKLIPMFNGISEGAVAKTGMIMNTSIRIISDISTAAWSLAGSSVLVGLAPAIAIGMGAIYLISLGLKKGIGAVINAFAGMKVTSLSSVQGKISAVVGVIGDIARIGTILGLAAAPLAAAKLVGGSALNSIKSIANSVYEAVSGLITRIATLPSSADVRAKVGIFTTIVQTVIGFGNVIRGLLNTGSVFEGLGNRARSINSLIRTLVGQISGVVAFFIEKTNSINVSVLQPKLAVITGIMSSIGSFARIATNAHSTDEDVIGSLTMYVTEIFRSFRVFLVEALPHISGLITAIGNASAISGANPAVVTAFGQLIGIMFTSVGNIIKSVGTVFTRQGSIIANAEDLATAAPALGRAIGQLVSGLFGNNDLFSSISQFIDGLVESASALASGDIAKVTAFSGILGPLFSAISSVASATAHIGAGAANGDPGAMDRLKETIRAVAGGISTEFITMINGLINTFGTIDGSTLNAISRATPILKGLLDNVTEMFTTISSFGSAEGGNTSATTAQNAFRNINDAIFGTGGTGWSLAAFVDVFGPNRGEAPRLLAALSSNQGTIATLGSALGAFKQSIQSIFGVVDSQFSTTLTSGLAATLAHVGTTVEEIISNINHVHEQINEVGRSININAALANLGETIGTATPERFQIARGDLTINVTVNVTLEVDEIERAIATRSNGSSFIINKEAQGRRPHLAGGTPAQ